MEKILFNMLYPESLFFHQIEKFGGTSFLDPLATKDGEVNSADRIPRF
jgi:hypothetical protein